MTDHETDRQQNTLEYSADGDSQSRTHSQRPLSRRRFVQASAATGALLLGGSSIAAGQSVADETCESFGEITVGDNDDFLLVNNDWGAGVEEHGFEMCSRLYDDGSYGYEWDARPAGGEPNYPQVLLGTKPWGDDSDADSFPIQRGDVDELILDIDVDLEAGGGEWNLAEEWWLMEQPPSQETETHTHEIMLVLEWGEEHSHGGVDEPGVRTDQFGNTIDYWTVYNEGGGTNAAFHIFRVSGGMTTGRVDLTEVIDVMDQRYGLRDDLWLSGVEVGNEYWEGAWGDVTYNNLDVTINGTTYESGSGDGTDDDDDENGDDDDDQNGDDSESIDVGDYKARDTTDDGLHNDFTGDGETTHDDVTAFFENLDNEAVRGNTDAFDFAENGRVGFADVVDLLRRV